MKLLEIMQNRRSVRKYTGESIADEKMEEILQAGLLSASSRAFRPWEFIVVRDKEMLDKMASCRDGAANMLKGADAAIVVIADGEKSDVWIEDCSIVMSNMHLMADSLGIGSCCKDPPDSALILFPMYFFLCQRVQLIRRCVLFRHSQ